MDPEAAAPVRAIGDAIGDDALMARIAARDAAAFRLVAVEHGLMLRRIAYRMLADASEAEDVAQDALARLWEHAGRWRSGGPGIGAWLNRVAVNACLDRIRKRRFVGEDAAPERADEAPLADVAIEAEQRRAAVVACVQALADRQRAAIVLTYYEGLSNLMAADALDMNIKAFESLLYRARQTLQALLLGAGVVEDEREDAA